MQPFLSTGFSKALYIRAHAQHFWGNLLSTEEYTRSLYSLTGGGGFLSSTRGRGPKSVLSEKVVEIHLKNHVCRALIHCRIGAQAQIPL